MSRFRGGSQEWEGWVDGWMDGKEEMRKGFVWRILALWGNSDNVFFAVWH